MSIVYALIAKDKDMALTTAQIASGNFPQITQEVLRNIYPDTEESFKYNPKYRFTYISEDSLTYICLHDTGYRVQLAKKFLRELKEKFLEKYSK
jgi:hypothetical protein